MDTPNTFWFNPDIDMTKIKDSMQIDSETTIATLKTEKHFFSLEVRGDVKVWFNPDKNGDPGDGDYYIYPSEFPQELKDIISGNAPIYRKDNDTEDIETIWTLDDRLYISENNWFELFRSISENDPVPQSVVVDVEGYTPSQILEMMLEWDEEE